MDGKWDKWWLLPLLALALLGVQIRQHWRAIGVVMLAVAVLVLTGCATVERVVTVKVAVPVACDQQEPARPVLAIDTLDDFTSLPLDQQNRHLRADHDERDGYETKLRAALRACQEIGVKQPASG